MLAAVELRQALLDVYRRRKWPRGAYAWRFSHSRAGPDGAPLVHAMVMGLTLCGRANSWGQRYSLRDVDVNCRSCLERSDARR